MVHLLMECSGGIDSDVGCAGLLALGDLVLSFPASLHPFIENRFPARSALLLLLTLAATSRCAPVAQAAHQVLMLMAQRMPQRNILPLLEHYLDHRMPGIRSEASRFLLVATYRCR